MAKVKYMNKRSYNIYKLWQYPNFSASGSVAGMKEKYYGKDALLVRSGSYIYKVPYDIYARAD